jgi:hypothetical protein
MSRTYPSPPTLSVRGPPGGADPATRRLW